MSTAREEQAIVRRLAHHQRAKLRIHRNRIHWRKWGSDRFYVERLIGETLELMEAINNDRLPSDVWNEAADIANFAAMLADRYESRQPIEVPPTEE
jgi:NTP pyrophosphatase (non-canonical NTP hydrolase)